MDEGSGKDRDEDDGYPDDQQPWVTQHRLTLLQPSPAASTPKITEYPGCVKAGVRQQFGVESETGQVDQ
jgi:hypothetical protein